MSEETSRVLVTGTSSGLGMAIAHDLARDYKVIGVARRNMGMPESLVDHRSGVDLSQTSHIDELAEDLGACDGLVNNVGVAVDGIIATQSMEDIDMMINVNLRSVLYLTKLYVRERLARRKSGIVVTISSIVALRGYRGLVVYSATKAALNGMTRALSREMGGKGFRFNVLLPGFIQTAMSDALRSDQREQIIRRTSLGRLGEVDDVLPVVRFLLSDDARFITGQEIVVDGGLTA